MSTDPKKTYLKKGDKDYKLYFAGESLDDKSIDQNNPLVQDLINNNYAYYSDQYSVDDKGSFIIKYDNSTQKYDITCNKPNNPENTSCCPFTTNLEQIRASGDYICPDPNDSTAACGVNKDDHSNIGSCMQKTEEEKWICDKFYGCRQLTSEQYNQAQEDWQYRGNWDSDTGLPVYSDASSCKANCNGPYSRCNAPQDPNRTPGYAAWTNWDGTNQSYFFCDKNRSCHKYNPKDLCFCGVPAPYECIPPELVGTPFDPLNGWAWDSGPYARGQDAHRLCGQNEFPTKGSTWISVNPAAALENNHSDIDEDIAAYPTTDGYDWRYFCDFTGKIFNYTCNESEWRPKDFCAPTVRDGLIQHGAVPIIMNKGTNNTNDGYCSNNDLTGVQLPDLGAVGDGVPLRIGGDGYYGNITDDFAIAPGYEDTIGDWELWKPSDYVNKRIIKTDNTFPKNHQFGAYFFLIGPANTGGVSLAAAQYNCADGKPSVNLYPTTLKEE
jgi:hypothetical protein